MFADTLLVFDHLAHTIKVVSHVFLDGDVEASYREAVAKIELMVDRLTTPLEFPRSLRVDPSAAGQPVESSFTQVGI